MADMPPNILNGLRMHAKGAHTHHMNELKGNIGSSNNVVRHSAARMLDEGSPANAAAIRKVLALPVKS